MPIRPEERARYPKDWPAISRRIREREGQRCKWCGAPNHAQIVRLRRDPSMWELHVPEHDMAVWSGPTLVVLTVAHLDHTPENCDDDNLAALCQRCHNVYDLPHRRAGIRDRARARRAAGDLFGGRHGA